MMKWILAIIVLAHVVLGALYVSATPYRTGGKLVNQAGQQVPEIGAPDERQHANYIQALLDGKGIPYLLVNVPNQAGVRNPALEEDYEAHQPPLYYLAATGWAKIAGVDDVESQGARSIRYLNLLFGALTVVGVYFFCIWGFRNPGLGVIAAAIAGLLPMNIALSAAISNDPLLIAICTWSLAIYAKGMMKGWTVKLAILAGSLAGLGILTKTSALPLLLMHPLAIHLGPKQDKAIRIWLTAALSALLLAVPWWVRNVMVYEPQGYGMDFLAMNVFKDAFADNTKGMEALIQNFGPASYWIDWVGWWTARSFFGVFGSMDIFLNPRGSAYDPNQTAYRIMLAFTVLLAIGWILRSRQPEWQESKKVQTVGILFLLVTVLLFLRFNMIYFQGQGRYLYPAIAVIASGLAAGALYWLKDKWHVALALLGGALLALNLYIVLSLLPEEFARRIT